MQHFRLLLTAFAALAVSGSVYAADIDETAKVAVDAAAWNAGGLTATGFSPAITTADGRTAQLAENYNSSTASVTGVILHQNLTGLTAGTYTVKLYANAMLTPNRGIGDDTMTEDGDTTVAFVYAYNGTDTLKTAIKAVRNDNSLSGNGEYTIENVTVGEDGTLELGLLKAKGGTNWNNIQIGALTRIVSEDAALTNAKNNLQAEITAAGEITPTSDALQAAIATAQTALDAADATTESINSALAALKAVEDEVKAANAAAAALEANTKAVEGATPTNPILTTFVVNGTMDADPKSNGWQTTTGAQNQGTATNQTGAFTGKFFENWNPSDYIGSMFQDVENIPNGIYRLDICAFVSKFSAGNQYVYANGDSVALTTGTPTAYQVWTAVKDNKVQVGFTQTAAVNNWSGIDNVSLTYYGEGDDVNAAKNAALYADAETLLNTKQNADVLAALTAAYTADTTASTDETIAALTAAVNNSKTSANAYEAAKKALDDQDALMASTNVYTQAAYDTYKAAHDASLEAYEAGSLTNDEANAIEDPSKVAGWHSANTYDNFLMSAFDADPDAFSGYYINTWSVEGDNDGSHFSVPFFEYWTGDAESLAARTMTATLKVAPGTYGVTAIVRPRVKNDGGSKPEGIYVQVNDGTAVDATNGVAYGQLFVDSVTAIGTVGADSVLNIKFIVDSTSNVSWLAYKNVKYYALNATTNLDFEAGDAIDNGICTYDYDMAKNSTTYSGLQPVTGWTEGENGNGRAAGVFAYGGTPWVGGTGFTAPATNPAGVAEGKALGIVAVWGATAQYTQDVTLPAGTYKITFPIYNSGNGKTAPVKSLFGFITDDGTEYLAPAKSYENEWTNEVVTFTLDKITSGKLSVGYQSPNAGSGANQHLFVDEVKIETTNDAAEYEAALANAKAVLDSAAFVVVTGEERAALDSTIKANETAAADAYVTAKDDLNAAVATFTGAASSYQALADAKTGAAAYNAEAYPYASVEKLNAVQDVLALEATSASDATAKIETVKTALRTVVESNAAAEGVAGATEVVLQNPNAEAAEGWTETSDNNGRISIKNAEPWTSADGTAEHSYFDGGNWGGNSWDVTYTQDVNLPAGRYVLSAVTRASNEMASFDLVADTTAVAMQHIGADLNTGLFNRGWNGSYLTFDLADSATVKIGVHGVANSIHQWMSFSSFKLVSIPNPATGINSVNANADADVFATPADVYTVGGVLVKKAATSLDGLGHGVYVVKGKKIVK